MSKREQGRFRLLALGYIASLPSPDRSRPRTLRDHEVDTPLGPLGISLVTGGSVVCVHCVFEYPRVAAAVLGSRVNDHSGKWNFYYGSGWTGPDAFEDWQYYLKKVMGVTWVLPGST